MPTVPMMFDDGGGEEPFVIVKADHRFDQHVAAQASSEATHTRHIAMQRRP